MHTVPLTVSLVAIAALVGCSGSSNLDFPEGSGGAGASTGTRSSGTQSSGTQSSGTQSSGTQSSGSISTGSNPAQTGSTSSGHATSTGAGQGGASDGGASPATTSNGAGGGDLGGASPAGSGGAGATTGAGGGGGGDPCSAAAKLVYVFSLDNDIYSFDPPSKQFTKIASPDCNVGGRTPNSMAIDRNLVAWLNYFDSGGGGIYTFDLNTKTGCQEAIELPTRFHQIGMGFASDGVGSLTETLYIDSISNGGLARVDMTTTPPTVVPIAQFSGDAALRGQAAELTGTGNANLFGYFTTSPYVRVAEIQKTTGAILSDFELTGVTPPNDWAFSFWGGDFYLYAGPGSFTGNSSVIHYTPTTQAVDTAYVDDVGFLPIIGAGVSTCAPVGSIHPGG